MVRQEWFIYVTVECFIEIKIDNRLLDTEIIYDQFKPSLKLRIADQFQKYSGENEEHI